MQAYQHIISFLSNYIQINTAHPDPAYDEAIAFLQAHARKDGLMHHCIDLGNGTQVFVATLVGSDTTLPALALIHHMDVVPALDEPQWVYPPFAGVISEDIIYGRGAQDMKSVGVIHYHALRALAQSGKQPRRTLHVIAAPDEELGGFAGTNLLLQTKAFEALKIGYVLDEGVASGVSNTVFIKVTERKPLQGGVRAVGIAAHGSHLLADNPIHKLVQVCSLVVQGQEKRQLNAGAYEMQGKQLSVNITSLQAGHAATYNAVPASAEAIFDIRVPQAMSLEQAQELLEQAVQSVAGVSYEVLASVADYVCADQEQTELYALLAQACEQHGLRSIVYHAEATTDLRYYLQQGMQGLGISPFTCKEALHATNESLPVANLVRGYKVLCTFLTHFC